MRPSFVIMLAVGLGLMGIFWWKTWQVEEEKVAAEALITGCAATPNCPADLPECLTGFGEAIGICSVTCAADSQCPESWCCPLAEEGMTARLCAPRQVCLKLRAR